jgi:hypothetical protein
MIAPAYQSSVAKIGAHSLPDCQARLTFRNNPPPTMAGAPACLSLDQLPNRPKGLAYGAGRVIPARQSYCLI